jgi:hypothetical protein
MATPSAGRKQARSIENVRGGIKSIRHRIFIVKRRNGVTRIFSEALRKNPRNNPALTFHKRGKSRSRIFFKTANRLAKNPAINALSFFSKSFQTISDKYFSF